VGLLRRATDSAALAVAFLTVLPVRRRGEAAGLDAAAVWFPAVGALVGATAGGVRAGADGLVGPSTSAVLAAATLVGLTGALHQDGLADCFDGLGIRGDRARRLEVMRDSAIGVFGVLALLVWMLLVVTALAGLDTGEAVRALVLACVVGRWAALLHAVLASPARTDGLGASFGVGPAALGLATVTTLAGAVLLAGVGRGLAVVAAALLLTFALTGWSRATLGGRTGDTLGAAVALTEVVVLLVLLGFATG
jgi:adenosylcobinamide-GDP ribazoletransferase